MGRFANWQVGSQSGGSLQFSCGLCENLCDPCGKDSSSMWPIVRFYVPIVVKNLTKRTTTNESRPTPPHNP